MKRILKNQAGLTLIELIAALSISVAVLGVIILLSSTFQRSLDQNFSSYSRKNPVRLVQDTIENYTQKAVDIQFNPSPPTLVIRSYDNVTTTFTFDIVSGNVSMNGSILTTLDSNSGISFRYLKDGTVIANTIDMKPGDSNLFDSIILAQLKKSSNQNGRTISFITSFVIQPIWQN